MSAQSVDIARRFVEAVNAREVPDVVGSGSRIENVPTAVTDEVYYGREGARKWMNDLFEAFGPDARFEHEVITAADDHVVARLRVVGAGSASGAPLDLRWVGVMWIEEGQIVRAAGYESRREALEAARLSE